MRTFVVDSIHYTLEILAIIRIKKHDIRAKVMPYSKPLDDVFQHDSLIDEFAEIPIYHYRGFGRPRDSVKTEYKVLALGRYRTVWHECRDKGRYFVVTSP